MREDNEPVSVPAYHELMWPTLLALRSLGGSGSIDEIYTKVAETEAMSDSLLAVLHGNGPQTEVGYRLHWARSYLKSGGALDNVKRGVWAVTDAGRDMTKDDVKAIPAKVRATPRTPRKKTSASTRGRTRNIDDLAIETEVTSDESFRSTDPQEWKDVLLEALLSMSPNAFERLCQRVLRESGFTKVEVTGRSGDGGIDGIGVLRMSLLSFQVFFQCKRYRGSVSSGSIRDFRGAMVGRTDKGLFITTGTFTPDAIREATRDGAPVLDLIDGDEFCDLLKNLDLGLSTEMVEAVTVDRHWFQSI
ncbi:MAG TPA: restriction endonuclease [Chloroflexi bacterium]|jgi:restriction system protein|nr:restriction endonuclease [Chloroflexota bacterium]HBY45583.1 restriction endonuclease [Chloroflexota bacterium]HCG28293.1 restriction endonuclease [Chloroflexota bacterium]